MAAKCNEVASAINRVFQLDESDQASLLAVIEDYFTLPSASSEDSDDSESESSPEDETCMDSQSSPGDETCMDDLSAAGV